MLSLQHIEYVCRPPQWSDDESRILSCGTWGYAHVWDAVSGERLLTVPEGYSHDRPLRPNWGATWNADDSLIATWGAPGKAVVWDATTGAPVFQIENVADGAWSPDGTRFVTWGYTVQVLDVITGDLLVRFDVPERLQYARWNANGSQILGWGDGLIAYVWAAQTGDVLLTMEHGMAKHGNVSLALWNSDESRILTCANDGAVRVWTAP